MAEISSNVNNIICLLTDYSVAPSITDLKDVILSLKTSQSHLYVACLGAIYQIDTDTKEVNKSNIESRHVAFYQDQTLYYIDLCGQLYSCSKTDLSQPYSLPEFTAISPFSISEPSLSHQVRASQVACGQEHILCLTESGLVYSWGKGIALGHGSEIEELKRPELIPDLQDVVQIAAGDYHSVAITGQARGRLPSQSSVTKRNAALLRGDLESQIIPDSTGSSDDLTNNSNERLNNTQCDLDINPSAKADNKEIKDDAEVKEARDILSNQRWRDKITCDTVLVSQSEAINVFRNDHLIEEKGANEYLQQRLLTCRYNSDLEISSSTPKPEVGSAPDTGVAMQMRNKAASSTEYCNESLSSVTAALSSRTDHVVMSLSSRVADLGQSAVKHVSRLTERLSLSSLGSRNTPVNGSHGDSGDTSPSLFDDDDFLGSFSKNTLTSRFESCFSNTPSDISQQSGYCPDLSHTLKRKLWVWGSAERGQLGLGHRTSSYKPTLVRSLVQQEELPLKIACGSFHTLLLTANSQLFAWGDNTHGQLGLHADYPNSPQGGNSALESSPQKVIIAQNGSISEVAAGGFRSAVLLYVTHRPDVYLFGQGVTEEKAAPMKWTEVKKLGWANHLVCSTGHFAVACDVNPSHMTRLLHEFAASERVYLTRLRTTLLHLVNPLLDDIPPSLAESQYGNTVLILFQSFTKLHSKVLQNVLGATAALKNEISVAAFLTMFSSFLEVTRFYIHNLSNVIAVWGFPSLAKDYPTYINKISEKIVEIKSDPASYLAQTFATPLAQLEKYNRVFTDTKKALGDTDYRCLTNLCRSLDILSEELKSTIHKADVTQQTFASIPSKLRSQVSSPKRRVILDNRSLSLSTHKSGKPSSSQWFLLCNDSFIYVQSSSCSIYPLNLVWAKSRNTPEKEGHSIQIKTPEEEFIVFSPDSETKTVWLKAIFSEINKVLDSDNAPKRPQSLINKPPPKKRFGCYTFIQKKNTWEGCRYEGSWYNGQMHGKGKLKWSNGAVHTGMFRAGTICGEGVYVYSSDEKKEIWDGIWKEGKLNGFGSVNYLNGDFYEGWFVNGQRHGHGILKRYDSCNSLLGVYVGEWRNNKKGGYGVEELINEAEKYFGQWENDQKQGRGILVTITGLYLEGQFDKNKMTGNGMIITNSGIFYEGEVYQNQPYGKGVMKGVNGEIMTGTFSGSFDDELKFNGSIKLNSPDTKEKIPSRYGQLCVPAHERWMDIYSQCYTLLLSEPCPDSEDNPDCCTDVAGTATAESIVPGDADNDEVNQKIRERMDKTARAWAHIASTLESRFRNKKQSFSSDDSQTVRMDRIPTVEKVELDLQHLTYIRNYLSQAFHLPEHPLGQLMNGLVDCFTATYVGVGAHPRLLNHALADIEVIVRRLYSIIRLLFPSLPSLNAVVQIYQSHHDMENPTPADVSLELDHPDATSVMFTGTGLIYSHLMSRIYPALFTLYALQNEASDRCYWIYLHKLNKQSDFALFNYLDVDLLLQLFENGESPSKRPVSHCKSAYSDVIDTFKRISTAFCPEDKLLIVEKSFQKLTAVVRTRLERNYSWNMDTLFPIFQFVVIRACVPNLGAEVHFIEDLMESHLQLGEIGVMFTTLKASYIQITNEKGQ